MAEVDKAMFYIFVLSLILVASAYYVGSTSVLKVLGAQVGQLIMTSTGRDSKGNFAGYPTNPGGVVTT